MITQKRSYSHSFATPMTDAFAIVAADGVVVAPSPKHIAIDAIVTIFAIASTAVLMSIDSTIADAVDASTASATAVIMMTTQWCSSNVADGFEFVAVWRRPRQPHFAITGVVDDADLTRMVSIRLAAAATARVTNRDGTATTTMTIKKVGGKVEVAAR